MGRTLLRANLRRKKRRRTLPCRRFCSCCCDDNTKLRKSCTSSLHKKQEAVKKQGSGRILKTTKEASTVKVKLSNGQKPVRLKRGYPGRTNSINYQLKKVIVNVTRLSEEVLSVLSKFGSICACEVDSGSVCCNSNPASKSVKSLCWTTPTRRLRSTPIVPVDRHTPSSVMDELRVLNADWRSSTYPLSVKPSFSSKAPENIPLPRISMKTLFLQNLSICKKAPNDESTKENVKIPQNVKRPGDNLQLLKDRKDITTSASGFKSPLKSTKPCKLPFMREPVTTRQSALSKETLSSLPPKMLTRPSQSISSQKPSRRPKILRAKPIIVGKSKFPAAKNLSSGKFHQKYVPYTSLLKSITVENKNTNVNLRKQSLALNPGKNPSKTDSKDKGVVLESFTRANTADVPCGISPGVDDFGSPPKKQKIQDSDMSRDSAVTTPRIPAAKTPHGKNHVYTIVLSDSSDDEQSYVLVDDVAPPKHAVAKLNTGKKKTFPKRKLATGMLQGRTDSKAAVSSRKKSSDTRASKNMNRSNPKVPVKKAFQTKNSIVKKNPRAKKQLCDSESEELYSSDSGEPPNFVRNRTRRARGSWKGGCRSCPGCQIDVPRKQQPKQVPVRNKVRPKRKSHSTDSDSSIEIINIIPREDRRSPKPAESPPAVIIHGLTSSDDSLDDIKNEQVLGDGRTALVFVTEPPGSEVSEEGTSPAETFGNPTRAIPEQVLDVDELDGIGSTARSPKIHGQDTWIRKSGDTDLSKTNPSLDDSIKDGNPINRSFLEQQQSGYGTKQSVLRISDASYSVVSLENSPKLEIRQPDNLAIPCHKVKNSTCVPIVAPGVKDESMTQKSWTNNSSHGNTSMHGIGSSSPGDVELSNYIDRPKSQCDEKRGDVPLLVEYPSCESLDSSIAVENLDPHDYSGSNCSLSSLEPIEIFDQGGIEKGQDRGPHISSLTRELNVSKPWPEGHHEVLVEPNDSQKTNDCSVFENAMAKVNGVINDSRTSLVCRSACKQDSVLENWVVQNSMAPEVSLAIPASNEIQMLQSKVMPDEHSSVSEDGLDTTPDESSVVSHAFPAHGNNCEGPATINHVVKVSNFVSNPRNTPFSEYGSTSQGGVTGNEDLVEACEKSDVIFHGNFLQDKVAGQHALGTHQALMEDSHSTFDLPCPSIGSQEAPFKSATILQDSVPEMIAEDQDCEMSSGSDGVLRNTDQPKELSLEINHFVDNNCNGATTGEHRDSDNHASPEHQSQESISNELSHLLNDFVESVKLDNREVIIRKVNLKSSETMDNPAASTEPGSFEESASVAKELNLLVSLNPRLTIKKLPLLTVGNAAYSQEIDMSEDSATLNDHQVPEDPPNSAPDMTIPTKRLYERKGYPTPIKRLNPSVLSIIKYNDLEIDNDEPSLNDPPETDLVECVSSKGVRFALNPEDLSAIEDFLKARPPVDDRREAQISVSTKEIDSYHTADDLIIDNDEPPLNPSPLKRGKHPPPIPENEEDLEDLVIDNDAPPLNKSAEPVTEVKPVSNDSDCLIISSDDEECTLPAADSQLGKIPEVKISLIPPSTMHPRPKKKLFRIRRNSVVDSDRSSTNHKTGNLTSQLKLPLLDPQEYPRVVTQELFNPSELEIPGDDIMHEVVINDCGIQSKRQPSGKPLPPFQSSKNRLNVPVENPIGMPTIHNGDGLCSSQEGPCADSPLIGSTNQVIFDLGDLEFSDDDIVNEVVIDGSGTDPTSQPSWKPRPQIRGCQETLLQPQVYNLHGQPLKLDQGHFRDSGSHIASLGDTISTSQVSLDLSETFTDNSRAECLNVSDGDTLTASEGEGDVIVVSPPRPSVKKNGVVYKNGCDTKDSSYIALSDSDDDLIEVSAAPNSCTRVNRTRNFKPSRVNPQLQCVNLRPQASASRNGVLPTGTQVRAVPNGNGDFYLLVVHPNQLFPS